MDRRVLTRTKTTLAELDERQRQRTFQGLRWFLERSEFARAHVSRAEPSGALWYESYGVSRRRVRHFIAVVRERQEPADLRVALRGLAGAAFVLRKPVGK